MDKKRNSVKGQLNRGTAHSITRRSSQYEKFGRWLMGFLLQYSISLTYEEKTRVEDFLNSPRADLEKIQDLAFIFLQELSKYSSLLDTHEEDVRKLIEKQEKEIFFHEELLPTIQECLNKKN